MAKSTPWGPAQHQRTLAPGIVEYMTASHGGIHLNAKRVGEIPPTLKRFIKTADDGGAWFEEDCEWSLAATAFPQFFDDKARVSAEATLRNWFPEAWEAVYGRTLAEGESSSKDNASFLKQHSDDYIVTSALGSWHKDVPDGMVGCLACKGGIRTATATAWLVPKAEYQQRGKFGFVIDPKRHQQVSGFA